MLGAIFGVMRIFARLHGNKSEKVDSAQTLSLGKCHLWDLLTWLWLKQYTHGANKFPY